MSREYTFPGTRNFAQQHQASSNITTTPKWYDRFLDLLMGDDEKAASHRLALICSNCRLVNGQAPPGVQRLEEVGRWRCKECKAWNGVDESEVKELLAAAGSGSGIEETMRVGSMESQAEGGKDRSGSSLRQRKLKKSPEMQQKSKLDGTVDSIEDDGHSEPPDDFEEVTHPTESSINEEDEDEDEKEELQDHRERSSSLMDVDSPPAKSTRSKNKKLLR